MLEYIESFKQRLKTRSTVLFALLVSIISLSACGGSDGDDEFKEAVKVNYLNITSIEVISDNSIVEIGVTEVYQAISNAGTSTENDVTSLVRWSSSNDTVVSINSSGVATTLSEGVVEIRAEIADLNSSKDLNASPALLESISITRDDMPATVGECTNGYQMIANGNYEDEATPRNITNIVDWTSDEPEVATVTDEGEVATLKGGSVIFTASRDAEGVPVTGSTNLTVDRDLLTSIVVTPDTDVVVFIGASQQFKALGTYSDLPGETIDITDTVDWASSDEHLEVSTKGLAEGISEGNSDVTASCAGDLTTTPPIDPTVISPAVSVSVETPVILEDIAINDGEEFEEVDLSELSVQLRANLVYSDGSNPKDVTDDEDSTWEVTDGTATLLLGNEGKVFFTERGTSVISIFYTDSDGTKVSDDIKVIVN